MATVTIFHGSGRVWTTFSTDDAIRLVALFVEWQAQPGCGRIVVNGADGRVAEWRRTT